MPEPSDYNRVVILNNVTEVSLLADIPNRIIVSEEDCITVVMAGSVNKVVISNDEVTVVSVGTIGPPGPPGPTGRTGVDTNLAIAYMVALG